MLGSVACGRGESIDGNRPPSRATGGSKTGEPGEGEGGAGGALGLGGNGDIDAGGANSGEPCDPGTFKQNGACVPWSECAPGMEPAEPGTPTSDVVCQACAVGWYCAGGVIAAAPCPLETWDDDADPATACVAKSDCGDGEYVIGYGGQTEDRSCMSCPIDHFSKGPSSQFCTLWQDCPEGSYVANEPSTLEDRVCVECETGFTAEPNLPACTPWTVCTVELTPGTKTSDSVCKPDEPEPEP